MARRKRRSRSKFVGGVVNVSGKQVMRYNSELQRWCVTLSDREYGLHCGEIFSILIGGESIVCRLELGSQWYIEIENVRFNLRETDKYLITLQWN